jgi:hypothetical protein
VAGSGVGCGDPAVVAGDPQRVGIVLFATLQGIATLINGSLVVPEVLDGIAETAVEQFMRGSRRR